MDGAFINLVRGSRLQLYMGIDLAATPGQYGPDYTYISFPVEIVPSETPKKVGSKTVRLKVLCGSLKLPRYKVAVTCSKALYEKTTSLHFPGILEPDDSGELFIDATFRETPDVEALGNCVRLYQYV